MAEGTVTRLNMVFATDADTTFRVSLDDPDRSVNAEQVMLKMEQIADKGVLMDGKGNEAMGAQSASIVTTTTEQLF